MRIVVSLILALAFTQVVSAQVLQDTSSAPMPPPVPVDSIQKADTAEKEVFAVVEKMPEFPGGMSAMIKFLSDNINYPKAARKKGTEGLVIVQFVVSQTGKIENAKIVRKLGDGCDEEALRVVNSMPNWTPGEQRGKPVRVQYNLPIRFKITE